MNLFDQLLDARLRLAVLAACPPLSGPRCVVCEQSMPRVPHSIALVLYAGTEIIAASCPTCAAHLAGMR